MESDNFDIALIQETKRPTDTTEIHDHRCFFYGGGNPKTLGKEQRAGVAIILGPRAKTAWIEAGMPDPTLFPPIAKAARSIALDLTFKDFRGRPTQMTVMSVHLPHSAYSNLEYQECLHQLDDHLSSKPTHITKILGIDANAQTGTRKQCPGYEPCLGPYGIETPQDNEQGTMFLNFLMNAGLRSTTSFFQKKQYWTWTKKNGDCENIQLDYLCTNEMRCFKNSEVSSAHRSDHLSIIGEVKLAARMSKSAIKRAESKPTKNHQPQPNWQALQENGHRTIFNQMVFENLLGKKTDSIENSCNALKQASNILPRRSNTKKGWYAMDEPNLKNLQADWNKKKTVHDLTCANQPDALDSIQRSHDTLKAARKTYKKSCKAAKEFYVQSAIDRATKKKDPQGQWKAAKQLIAGFTGHHKKPTDFVNMINKDGTVSKTLKENAATIQQHFSEDVFGRTSAYDPKARGKQHQGQHQQRKDGQPREPLEGKDQTRGPLEGKDLGSTDLTPVDLKCIAPGYPY